MGMTKEQMDRLREDVWNKAFSDVVYENNQNLHQFASDYADEVTQDINESNAQFHIDELDNLF